MGWLFLAVSIVGAAFTLNALRPRHSPTLIAGSFFAAWITGELALWHIVWQAVLVWFFVEAGALETVPGWVGLALTLLSWAGLVSIVAVSLRARGVVERALTDGLGEYYDDEITGRRPRRVARRTAARRLVLPFLLRSRKVVRVKNLRYAPGAGRRHLLDVLHARRPPPDAAPANDGPPNGDRSPGNEGRGAPVLLQIHGGAWTIGNKSQQGIPLMHQLAAEGWVCVAINYRLSPRSKFPDHLVDCKLALAWIREHIAEYGGDPDFVVVTGGSAGGHLAALLALTPNDPRYQEGFEDVDTSVVACVPFYPPTDLVKLFRFGREHPTRVGDDVSRMFMGSTPSEEPERWRDASPVEQVGPHAPPFFVLHGSADNLVPIQHVQEFVAALSEVSAEPVCYAEIPGASHAFEIFYSLRTDAAVEGVDRFLAWVEATRRPARVPAPPADAAPAPVSPDRSGSAAHA